MTKEINGPVPNSIQDESLIKYSFLVLIFTKNVIGHYSAYPIKFCNAINAYSKS